MTSGTYMYFLWLVLKLVSGFIMPMTNSGGEPDIARVVSHVTLLEQTMSNLHVQIETSNNQIVTLTTRLTEDERKLHDMETEVKTTGSDMRIVQAELKTTMDEVIALRSQLQTTGLELGSTNTELKITTSEVETLRTKLKVTEDEILMLKADKDQRPGIVDLAQMKNDLADLKMLSKSPTLQINKTMIDSIRVDLESNVREIEALKSHVCNNCRYFNSSVSNTSLHNIEQQFAYLNARVNKTQTDLHNMELDQRTMWNNISDLDINKTTEEIASIRSLCMTTDDKLYEIASNLTTFKEELSSVHYNLSQIIAQNGTDVAFQVSQSAWKSGWTTLNFDTVDYNLGGGYELTSGYFTAPVSGSYILWMDILLHNSDGDISMYKNDNPIAKGGAYASGSGVSYSTGSVTVVSHLNIGETIHLTINQIQCTITGSKYSQFGGALIHAGSSTIS